VRRLAQWAPGWPPDSLGDVLISPFARVLEGATTLRVLAPASMHELSFADLPWRGRPLGDRLAVAHALDLPSVPLVDRREQAAALVFSDPEKLLLSHYDVLSRRFDAWRTQLETTGHRVAYVLPPAASSPSVSVQEILRGTAGVDLAVLYGFGAVQASYYDLLPTQAALREPDQDGFGVGADVLSRSAIV